MGVILWVLAGFLINLIIGAAVWTYMDKDGRLLEWYKNCPDQIAWIAQPAVLTLWPIGVWFKYFRKTEE